MTVKEKLLAEISVLNDGEVKMLADYLKALKSQSKASKKDKIRHNAIRRLRGIAQVDAPPLTKEDERKIVEGHLSEKYA